MRSTPKRLSTRLAALVGMTAAAASVVALAAPTATASANSGNIVYTVHPLTKQYTHNSATPSAFPTPSQCLAKYGLICYTPAEIRTAYGIPADWTGKGESIAIVDAYGSPTAASDLAMFSKTFGLPTADLHIYYPTGKPASSTAHKGQPLDWAGETSLDLQWAHAIAPDARINLVVASNNYGNTLNVAVKYAIDNNLGDTLSMSYGASEDAIKGKGNNLQLQQSHANFVAAAAKGISVFASAGDNGATDGTSQVTPGYPASDPLVTSVGGTNLFTDDAGNYQSETVWGDQANCPVGCAFGPIGATGGAPSQIFTVPSYQKGVNGNTMRTTSDVSYNASVYTSVLTYEGFNANPSDNAFYFFGGTSSGSPQWAAIGALADQQAGHRLGQLNPALYTIAAGSNYAKDFHDVTSGNNAFGGPGFDAKAGYDLPTGLGSPNVANLVADLAR